MLLLIIRSLFFLTLAAVGIAMGLTLAGEAEIGGTWQAALAIAGSMGVAAAVIILDVMYRRKDISVISAVFLGMIVGLLVATLLGPVVKLYVESVETQGQVNLGIAVVGSYLAISFILQTKDDFRFIIPYIEFSKQAKGGRPLLLDTSVIIDGRIADIAETRFLDSPVVVPQFVLRELQGIADSSDRLKRNRGRRGLDILNRLQATPDVDITIDDTAVAAAADEGVDQMLVRLAGRLSGRIVTNDYNLNKVAKLHGVQVINVNDLANALKPAVLPGEEMEVSVIRPGQEQGQGVGYLEDGTMVVVEDGRDKIGHTVEITVTSVLQTSAGRMIFGRIEAS
jgi:uncharacterized protein YacL